jgi:hypothetical protein
MAEQAVKTQATSFKIDVVPSMCGKVKGISGA